MDSICDINLCAGCGACVSVCPRGCITMSPDDLGCLHPVVDKARCVDCGLCARACQANHPQPLNTPMRCYAAWSTDQDTLLTSASGGVAAELYRHIINQGGASAGVTIDIDEGCRFVPVTTADDISRVKNSKYTSPDATGIYSYVKSRLQQGQPFLFIGLPCHVAALKSFLGKEYPNLVTVDLICHGKVPYTYLDQHIRHVSKGDVSDISSITFRDPAKKTSTFHFSIYRAGQKDPVYTSPPFLKDVYQIGYHRCLIYCASCYKCPYARRRRVGDITIGDFSGLSCEAPYSGPRQNVSCVLVNTGHGESFLSGVDTLSLIERPLAEALDYERQFNAPSEPHPSRMTFEKEYRKDGDFCRAASKALKDDIRRFRIERARKALRRMVSSLVPLKFKIMIARLLK